MPRCVTMLRTYKPHVFETFRCQIIPHLVADEQKSFSHFFHTVKWNLTDVGSVMCLYFLSSSLFCKYLVQLHVKQSTGVLSINVYLITTHPERAKPGGKTEQRYFGIFWFHYCIENLMNVLEKIRNA